MEVHKIEDVADIYVVEVDMQSIFCILCGCAVDGKVLLVVLYGEIPHFKVVLAVNDV